MKKNILALLCFVLLFSACEEQEFGISSKYIRFGEETSAVSEGESAEVEIPIYYSVSGDQRTEGDITVNITTSGTAVEQADYIITSGKTLTISAGEYVTYVRVQMIDNLLTDGAKQATFTISSNSADVSIGFPGPDGVFASHTLTINDDDCPLESSAFVGTFMVEEIFTSGTNEGVTLAGAFGESYQLQISQDPTDASGTKYIINNSAGYNEFFEDGTRFGFNTCDGTLTFTDGDPLIAIFANLDVQGSSYSESDSEIIISGPLGNFGPYEIKLTRL